MLSSIVKRYMRDAVKIYFGLLEIQGKFLYKLKARDFNATSLSTYDSLLFTLLYLIILLKKNVLILFKEPSREKALLTLHVTTETHFYVEIPSKYYAWSCQNVCDALTFLLDNIFIRFSTKLYRQVVGFLWALIVLPWLSIYSCFVMRGTL